MSSYLNLDRFALRSRMDAFPLSVLAVAIGTFGALLAAILASASSPMIALVGIIALACGIGMLFSPTFALLILCASLPFERIGRLTDDSALLTVSASRILGVIALGAFLIHALWKREKLVFGWPVWLFAGFTCIGLLSNAWTATPEETFKDSLRIFGNLLFFFYLINAIRDYKTARLAVMVWMLASLAAGAYSLSDYYLFESAPLEETQVGLTSTRTAGTVVSDGAEIRTLGMNVNRLFGTTAHPTLFGLNSLMTVPFLLWAIRAQGGVRRLLWLVGLLMMTFCILLSNTRAVFLLAIITFGYALVRRLIPLTMQMAVVGIALAVAVAPFIPEDVYRRTLDSSLYTASGGDAIRSRLKLLTKSLELVEQNFMTGIGVGDQTTLVQMVTDENTGYRSTQGLRASAHNEFIWILVEVGIVGYVFHFGFVWIVTAAGFKAAKRFRGQAGAGEQYFFLIACQCVLVAILLSAMQSATFHYPLKGWWLVAAISYVMWTRPEAMTSPDQAH